MNGGNALVGFNAPGGVRDIGFGDIGIHRDIHKAVAFVRCGGFPLGQRNGLIQHFNIQLVSHRLHVPVLAVPQKAAGTANLQIAHGNAEAAAEAGEFANGRKPLFGHLGEHLIAAEGEIGIGFAPAAPHAAPDLVELRKAHAVGILDHQRVAVAHINAGFNQGSTHQNVDLVFQKLLPHLGKLGLGHFAVGHANACAGHHGAHFFGALVDAVHPVVQIIGLAAARQLFFERLGKDHGIVFQHIGFNGLALKGRLLNGAHIANAAHGHVERAGNGGGRKGEHIHPDKGLFQLFLVLHAKALLFVNDHKAQIFKLYIV